MLDSPMRSWLYIVSIICSFWVGFLVNERCSIDPNLIVDEVYVSEEMYEKILR